MSIRNNVVKILSAVPAMVIMVLCNTIIGLTISGLVMIEMLSAGCNKYLSLAVAMVVAIVVHLYVAFNHKLREYIKKSQGAANNE